MKTIHKATKSRQFPQFWNEEWLEAAIKELDTRAMTPEKRMAYEMTLSANALAIENEQKKLREAEEKKTKEHVENSLLKGLDANLIAEIASVSIDFVKSIQQKLSSNN